MSKAYLVLYSEGSYEDVTYNNVFITFDEQKAIDWVNKFNRIRNKWFKEYINGKWLYESTLEVIFRYIEVNQAIYKEIEIR